MTNRTEEYRTQVERCRQMADQVISPLDKEALLQLAAEWLALRLIHQRSVGRFDETKGEAEH
jgi:hypothetical protein